MDISAAHIHLDELARCISPEDLFQAVQPSAAGSLHCLTTSLGPAGFAAELWRKSERGETQLHPLFISALERPGRDERWYAHTLQDLGPGRTQMEYPRNAQEARGCHRRRAGSAPPGSSVGAPAEAPKRGIVRR